jgi:hypothetical protein
MKADAHGIPEACYGMMNRGLSLRKMFLEGKDRERFLELLGDPHDSGQERISMR